MQLLAGFVWPATGQPGQAMPARSLGGLPGWQLRLPLAMALPHQHRAMEQPQPACSHALSGFHICSSSQIKHD